jgi:WD40 repeat protein
MGATPTATVDDFPTSDVIPLVPTSGRTFITTNNLDQVTLLARIVPTGNGLVAVDFSPDGRYMAVGDNTGTVIFYDFIRLRNGNHEPVFSRKDGTQSMWDVAFHPYLDRLVTCVAGDNLLTLSDFEGNVLAQIDTGLSATQCNYSPNGDYIAYAGGERVKFFVVRENDGVQIDEIERTYEQSSTHDVIFSPDGTRLFISDGVGFTIRGWSNSFDVIATPYDNNTWSVNPLPNGNVIATGSNGFVAMYDADGQEITRYNGHTMDVIESAYNPTASLFVTGSWDNEVIFWDATGERVLPLHTLNHGDYIVDVGWSRDGALVASVGNNGHLNLWGIP